MTAPPVLARPEGDASLRPLPWRRMAWVTWRQHRIALIGVAVFLGAWALYVWLNGLQLHHAFAAMTACHPASSLACRDLISSFRVGAFLVNGTALQSVPALIGAFAGPPLLAREMETGTFRFAWTQGFGRSRWIIAKLVTFAAVLAVAVAALSVLIDWYYQPYFAAHNPALFPGQLSPFAAGLFDLRGIALVGWTLAAFAIGALSGMLIRRVVPSIAATLAIYAGLAAAAMLYLREHYISPLVTRNVFTFFISPPPSDYVVRTWWTKDGRTVSQSAMNRLYNSLFDKMMPVVHSSREGAVAAQKGPTESHVFHYLTQHGYTYWASYQPPSRFWPFQWIEAGWLLALSALLMAATVWLVRRRAA